MNISEFEKPAKEKLAKINEALDTLYGFRVYDTIDIKKLYDVKKDLKTKLAELEASLPFNTANTDPKYMKHVLLAEAIENMIEAKKKDHDKDGDIDSDDYMAAKDKAIKKAMGKDKEVKEELTDKQKKLPAGLQKAIAKKQGDKVEEKVSEIKQLLEQEVERAEIVIAAKSIVDELQNMIEDLGKLQNDELGAIVDQMSYQFGGDEAASFNTAVATQLDTLLSSIKASKEAVNNEVLKLTGEAPATSDMSATDTDLGDMADDGEDLEAPADDLTGADDAASGPEEEPLGRAKKA